MGTLVGALVGPLVGTLVDEWGQISRFACSVLLPVLLKFKTVAVIGHGDGGGLHGTFEESGIF